MNQKHDEKIQFQHKNPNVFVKNSTFRCIFMNRAALREKLEMQIYAAAQVTPATKNQNGKFD